MSALIYLRDAAATPTANIQNDMQDSDIFLGSITVTPNLDDTKIVSQSWFQLQGVGSGDINIQVEYSPFRVVGHWSGKSHILGKRVIDGSLFVPSHPLQKRPLSMESFELMMVVGRGTFGKVLTFGFVSLPTNSLTASFALLGYAS